MFSAAVLRNPVISVGDISSSDIRDWYFSEFGIEYPLASSNSRSTATPTSAVNKIDQVNVSLTTSSRLPPLISSKTYADLLAASPISRIDSIKTPVLLLIGSVDRRVAPSQGIDFYHALKARYATGVNDGDRKVEMLIFEGESHPLDGVEAAKASFEVTREWLAGAGYRKK